jgi:hypothetical protein
MKVHKINLVIFFTFVRRKEHQKFLARRASISIRFILFNSFKLSVGHKQKPRLSGC